MSGKEFFVDRYERLGWKFQDSSPRQAIRINISNAKGRNLEQRLASRGVELEKIAFLKHGYWILRSKVSVGATEEYLLGLYSIQEAAAQIPATLFTDPKGKLILDACAAPGGKTVQLANLTDNTGAIVAMDVEKRRLAAFSNQLERCHISNTVVYNRDSRRASNFKLMFDKILLDVPCSGNFASEKNWFARRTIKDVGRNARLQREILTETAKCLKGDGEIVYSTCSLEPEENELNMNWAIENLDMQIEKVDCHGQDGQTNVFGQQLDDSITHCKRIWPDDTQGFFVCKLKKRRNSNQ